MTYKKLQKIKFKHCDPAGIVFYPRYFEMLNDCVEDFFEDVLEMPFSSLHPNNGMPTALIETEFLAPSRLGDSVPFELAVKKLGRSSLNLEITAKAADNIRLRSKSTLVHVGKNGRSARWPEKQHKILNALIQDQ